MKLVLIITEDGHLVAINPGNVLFVSIVPENPEITRIILQPAVEIRTKDNINAIIGEIDKELQS